MADSLRRGVDHRRRARAAAAAGDRADARRRSGSSWRTSSPARLLQSRLFILFLIAIGCTHGAHATFYTFGALHWQAQGLSAAWVGTLWAIGVFAEVVLFALSAPVVRRFGAGAADRRRRRRVGGALGRDGVRSAARACSSRCSYCTR